MSDRVVLVEIKYLREKREGEQTDIHTDRLYQTGRKNNSKMGSESQTGKARMSERLSAGDQKITGGGEGQKREGDNERRRKGKSGEK